jgi:transposase InsO family protein
MSRRGNCYDNAVVKSFFSNLKKERIWGKTYLTRDTARADIFVYIEVFYNRTRRHSKLGMFSPADFEEKKGGVLLSTNSGGPVLKTQTRLLLVNPAGIIVSILY